jgi:acyl carrier protein
MSEKVFEIISAIAQRGAVGLSVAELKDRMNEQGLWDSLLHVELVIEIESEFDIFFSQEEIAQIDTPAKVLEVVTSKISAREA